MIEYSSVFNFTCHAAILSKILWADMTITMWKIIKSILHSFSNFFLDEKVTKNQDKNMLPPRSIRLMKKLTK